MKKKTSLNKFVTNKTNYVIVEDYTSKYTSSCIKWAGGKSKLLNEIFKFNTSGTLYDVFAGSAVIGLNGKNNNIVINDINNDLIELYKNIKDNHKLLIRHIDNLLKSHSKEQFESVKKEFNKSSQSIKKSAMFVYLNKTCFNGLCRYNKKGEFNTTIGKTASGKIPETPRQKIIEMNNVFNSKHYEFTNFDFETILQRPKSGDFVVLDPPYTPLDKNGFVNYVGSGFTEERHTQLTKIAIELMSRGVTVIIFDHDLPVTRKRHEQATKIVELSVSRSISRNGKTRKKVAEIMAVYERI